MRRFCIRQSDSCMNVGMYVCLCVFMFVFHETLKPSNLQKYRYCVRDDG